jgi:predicted DNA-binding transcriptional regulator AlpA
MEIIIASEILSRKEAAAYLRICKTTLDTLDIPRVKIRHLVLYRKSDIDQWLTQKIQVKGA